MSINEDPRPRGRRNGAEHGTLRATVLQAVNDEDRTNPITDLAIAAEEGVTESAISEARRAIGIPVSRLRSRVYLGNSVVVRTGLATCDDCLRNYQVPSGRGGVECPNGHGKIVLSTYQLLFK